jgi:sugar (pentulose or hexulose) kinase
MAGAEVVLAVDVGTGGARVMAYALDGTLLRSGAAEYPTYHDRPAWAEQDPEAWGTATLTALSAVARQLDRRQAIRAIGLTGQCPTIAPFDREGRPLRRGIIYQDNRAAREAREWTERLGGREAVHRRTGQDPETFYIGPKILWVRRHEPEVFDRAEVWLQPRDYVARQLTGTCATDWSQAGCTLLFDAATCAWADDAFESLGLPPTLFPPALAPWSVVGELQAEVAAATALPAGIPVVIGGADSMCCAVGAAVLNSAELSDMAGTSTCLNAPVRAPLADVRIANYRHVLPGWWCTELGLNASGAAFEWLARLAPGSKGRPAFRASEAAARRSEPGARGLIFLPYLADGERFDPAVRGGFCGLSLRHDFGNLARAVLEGVAFAIHDAVGIMDEAGAPVREIHVSGGGARVDLWNQIKADVTGVPVVSVASDATALGVALLAGVAVGLYPSPEAAVARCVRMSRRYEPDPALGDLYAERYARFRTLALATAEPTGESA